MAIRFGLLLALLLASGQASAHGSVQGLGNFFSGVVHPLLDPAHLIALLALGLLIGQRGLRATHPAVPGFLIGATLGLIAVALGWAPDAGLPLLVLSALIALSVASAVSLPRAAVVVAATVLGLGIGFGSDPDGMTGNARLVMLLGTGVGLGVWLLNIVGLVHEIKRPWLLILVRVVGSWIGAAAVLVLALWIAGKNGSLPAPALAKAPAASALVLDTAR